jgi:hypothetical protein
MMGEQTIKAIDELRQQMDALEHSLDDPSVKNWLTMASLALENAKEQLGFRWSQDHPDEF